MIENMKSGLVDWRGRPVDTRKHGGVRASIFVHAMVLMTYAPNIANILNMVSYLRGTMHMGVAEASTTASNYFAALHVFSIPGALLADSYIKRFYTIVFFAPIEIIGYIILAIQAYNPSLHPPACSPAATAAARRTCEPVRGANLSLLLLGLYLVPIGDGAMRACLPALGGDQFDPADPDERRQKTSFYNWYTFAISTGGFVGLVFIVWVQTSKGWGVGFAVCTAFVVFGLLVWAAAFPLYRNQPPMGRPVTRNLQVFVAAFKKRNVRVPEDPSELKQINQDDDNNFLEVLPKTDGFRCLDKATGETGNDAGAWSLCSVTQVEETKIVLRLAPIFATAVLSYIPVPLIFTLTVQQGNTMDTRLGSIHISPATLFMIPIVFQIVILIVYDRVIVPPLRRLTGYVGGLTHLQRIGVGFIATIMATAIAAVVETRRKIAAHESGLADATTGIPLSVFWLTPQFFLIGVYDVTSFVGLLEFFCSEVSIGMKSIGSSIFYCILGVSAWLGSLLIQIINRVTRRGDDGNGGGGGWLDGANLNNGKLERFYVVLYIIEMVALVSYVFFARRYVYRNDQRAVAQGEPIGDTGNAVDMI